MLFAEFFRKKETIKWNDFFHKESKKEIAIQNPLTNLASGFLFVPGSDDFMVWGLYAAVALSPYLIFKGLESMNLMNEQVYKVSMGIFRILQAILPIGAIIYLASKTMEAFV